MKVPNPYWPSTTSTSGTGGQPDDQTELDALKGYVIEVPASPANLNGIIWTYQFYTAGGSLISNGTTSADIIDEDTEYYDVYTYQWPKDTNGKTSAPARYVLKEYCNYTPVRIWWETELGGFDDMNFPLVSQKDLNVEHSTYLSNLDKQGHLPGIRYGDNRYIGHTDYDRQETVYNTDIEEVYRANVEHLTDAQVLDLESLWSSQNVFAQLPDGNIYPVVSLIKKRKIETTSIDIRNHDIEFKIANKKYIN